MKFDEPKLRICVGVKLNIIPETKNKIVSTLCEGETTNCETKNECGKITLKRGKIVIS